MNRKMLDIGAGDVLSSCLISHVKSPRSPFTRGRHQPMLPIPERHNTGRMGERQKTGNPDLSGRTYCGIRSMEYKVMRRSFSLAPSEGERLGVRGPLV